jgi:pectate lyase
LFLVIFLAGCESPGSGSDPVIISGQDYTSTLYIEQDNVIIRDCTFHGMPAGSHGLVIRNAENVTVENCTFSDIPQFGILLPEDGPTQNVTIRNCTLSDIGVHGIHAAERPAQGELTAVDHPGLVIENCLIHDTGTAGEWPEHDHGIYVQSSGFRIEGNTVYNSLSGHGISIRNTGVVSRNLVYNNYGSCIDYYNDHDGSGSGQLVIENNICWDNDAVADQAGKQPIDLVYDSTHSAYLVDEILIRFNTAVSFDAALYPFAADIDYLDLYDSGDLSVFGNLLVNAGSGATVNSVFQLAGLADDNYGALTLDGFVQNAAQPYDFHLTESHGAVGNGIVPVGSEAPALDHDGDALISPWDAGADQYVP